MIWLLAMLTSTSVCRLFQKFKTLLYANKWPGLVQHDASESLMFFFVSRFFSRRFEFFYFPLGQNKLLWWQFGRCPFTMRTLDSDSQQGGCLWNWPVSNFVFFFLSAPFWTAEVSDSSTVLLGSLQAVDYFCLGGPGIGQVQARTP